MHEVGSTCTRYPLLGIAPAEGGLSSHPLGNIAPTSGSHYFASGISTLHRPLICVMNLAKEVRGFAVQLFIHVTQVVQEFLHPLWKHHPLPILRKDAWGPRSPQVPFAIRKIQPGSGFHLLALLEDGGELGGALGFSRGWRWKS